MVEGSGNIYLQPIHRFSLKEAIWDKCGAIWSEKIRAGVNNDQNKFIQVTYFVRFETT